MGLVTFRSFLRETPPVLSGYTFERVGAKEGVGFSDGYGYMP